MINDLENEIGSILIISALLLPFNIVNKLGIENTINNIRLLNKHIIFPFLYSNLFLFTNLKINGTIINIKLTSSKTNNSGINSSQK